MRRRRRYPPRVHVVGAIPTPADFPLLAEALRDAWGVEVRIDPFWGLRVSGGNTEEFESQTLQSGPQLFWCLFYDEASALRDVERLATALSERDVPHGLDLCNEDLDDLAHHEHAWESYRT